MSAVVVVVGILHFCIYVCLHFISFCFISFFSLFISSWLLITVISYSGGQLDGPVAILAACPYFYYILLLFRLCINIFGENKDACLRDDWWRHFCETVAIVFHVCRRHWVTSESAVPLPVISRVCGRGVYSSLATHINVPTKRQRQDSSTPARHDPPTELH